MSDAQSDCVIRYIDSVKDITRKYYHKVMENSPSRAIDKGVFYRQMRERFSKNSNHSMTEDEITRQISLVLKEMINNGLLFNDRSHYIVNRPL